MIGASVGMSMAVCLSKASVKPKAHLKYLAWHHTDAWRHRVLEVFSWSDGTIVGLVDVEMISEGSSVRGPTLKVPMAPKA